MDDDDLYYDEFVDEIAADEFLALVDDADAAIQHQATSLLPQQSSIPPQHAQQREHNNAALGDTHGEKHVLQPPSRLLRNPMSFGDTDILSFDAGVLDDGAGPSPVNEQQQSDLQGGGHADRTVLSKRRERQSRPFNGPEAIAPPKEHVKVQGKGLQTRQEPRVSEDAALASKMELVSYESRRNTNEDTQSMEVEDMMDRIEQLARERERLLQELNSAKTDAETRAGEIAIIRANQAKLEQNHNRQLSALRSALEEELQKHQAEIDAAVMESKRLATENQFLKQDLREETFRLNEMQQNWKAKARTEDAAPTTPSKPRSFPLRDGFDDDEIMASPSKSTGRRSKRGTPSAPGKRKRAVTDDSPVVPVLQLSQSFESNLLDAVEPPDPIDIEMRSEIPHKEDRNVQFIRKILNHKSYPRKVCDLEVFAGISFPSEPKKMLSSYILEATTTRPSENFALEYAKVVISLWSRALKEAFYQPISMFMAIIKFILNLDSTMIAPLLVADLVPVLQTSGYVNGIPRFTNSPVSHLSYGQVKQTPKAAINHQVNSTEVLELLYLTGSGCCHDDDALRQFWQVVRYDFILMMLNPYQPVKDIIIVLNLLSCSIFPTTFGPILNTEAEQIANENYIIDRVANLLHEQPSVDEGEKPYTIWEITTLRKEAMSFLLEIAFSYPSPNPERNNAGYLLATHPSALARVFRAMHDELDALYSHPPERDLHVALVNGLTRLAYGIITAFPDIVDLPAKLRAVPGAVQKHLVVLTRLVFSEGLLLESGITEDTAEMAHEMLEDAVNPQEAEALLEAFRSSKGEG
ncbi:hypothetical protein PRK78_007262 [Emydomyces testavorans]|uniref:DNA repair protein Rad26 n=1 Tax=Emydomyces testavorans TaxID=2070801 RepID=A0AAF0ILI9_9EURO|nr:hypothetical protein PRK78_007262 [Emydomyces testavorans]